MSEDRRDVAEADEDGGGRDEELLSAGKPVRTGRNKLKNLSQRGNQ